ncbi:hypothetical protein NEF87_002224 [Candidatus Lokiarchaeum ossiferum]|uniref:DUF304 domain-containing protein n=1 Tax=Candidatus Lokiarchaeum ossiferum TaxID=2951803 RepID=A0ABY6HR07_9ARCH|nr:hypothetical protein NEF87_002224 [Candidatus Lokiarchaeum sp. B-35]
MNGYDPFKKSTLLPSYRELIETSELTQSKKFHISSQEDQIIIYYYNLIKIIVFGCFIIFLVGVWIINLVFFHPSWFGLVIMSFSIGIGIIIDYFVFLSRAFFLQPLIIDCDKEKIITGIQTIQFQEIQRMVLIQTASEFMSGGKQFFNLFLQGTNPEQKVQLYPAFFPSRQIFINFGKFMDQIFVLHGLSKKMDYKNVEFTNNFEHFPLID